jgi:dipeptidyl aminopeptidase/acylaminoacyl peptidase
MGLPLPTENFRGYQRSSLIDRCEWIRGKEFFLAHGMADRNVHFQNSMILAKTLVTHNIPFEQHVSLPCYYSNVSGGGNCEAISNGAGVSL